LNVGNTTNETIAIAKEKFKFFDFFATCEYFENDFPYDEKIKLPTIKKISEPEVAPGKETAQSEFVDENGNKIFKGPIDLATSDEIASISETPVGVEGMRIDREGFKRAIEEDVLGNETLKNMWANGDTEEAEEFAQKHIFDKPKYFLNLDKVRRIFNVDRHLTVKEFLQFAFGDKEAFEMKDDLLESEWQKFVEIHSVDQDHYWPAKNFFKAYIVDKEVRDIIKRNQPAEFFSCPSFDFEDYQKLNGYRATIPQYIHDYAYQLTNL
jgi:type I restriction enzyme R subunit